MVKWLTEKEKAALWGLVTLRLHKPNDQIMKTTQRHRVTRTRWDPRSDKILMCVFVEVTNKTPTLHPQWQAISRGFNIRHGMGCAYDKTNKQCSERWNQHLRPGIRTSPASRKEMAVISSCVQMYGTRWEAIRKHPDLKGRSANWIKNTYHGYKRGNVAYLHSGGQLFP